MVASTAASPRAHVYFGAAGVHSSIIDGKRLSRSARMG
jgi:hypothetical protein